MNKYINYLVLSKFAKGTDGHLPSFDLVDKIKNHDGSEAYYNHFDVREDALGEDEGRPSFKGAAGVCRPAFGLVGFDFDDEESPENSLRDVQAFLNYFRFEHFYVAYSGSKGFHISVPFEYFGLPADENLPKTLRNLAHELKPHFKTLDTSVYNIGRKFRAPNTKHGKTGLYKTIISHVGVDTKDMDAIKEYCKVRRDTMYEVKNYEVEPNKTLLEIIAKAKTTASYDKSKAGSALAPTRLEEYDGKICIKRLFEAEIDEGERNTTALILVNDLFKSGKAKEHCINVMTPWITRVMPEHRRAEVFQIIEDIFNGNRFYNHGCLEPIKSKHCSAKCGLWSKLAPTKRPTPVDAPKSAFKDEQKSKKLPAKDYIRTWLQRNIVNVNLKRQWSVNSKVYSKDYVKSLLVSDFHDYRVLYLKPTTQDYDAELEIFETVTIERLLKELSSYVSYEADNNLLERWLTAVLSRDATDLEVVVMKHWLWLVKRKLNELPVAYHIMPVFSGKTGSGKSVAVAKLIAPFQMVVDPDMDFQALVDNREAFRLVHNFIVFLDEMAKGDKTDVDKLKHRISSEFIQYRNLGKNSVTYAKNNACFIGATNNSLIDIIKDPTSSRRYFEYVITKKCSWADINDIDYIELWRGINENLDEGYLVGYHDKLREAQKSLRFQDSVEEWLSDKCLIPENLNDCVEVDAHTAYTKYKEWNEEQNRKFIYSKSKFGREMSKYTDKKRTSEGVKYLLTSGIRSELPN